MCHKFQNSICTNFGEESSVPGVGRSLTSPWGRVLVKVIAHQLAIKFATFQETQRILFIQSLYKLIYQISWAVLKNKGKEMRGNILRFMRQATGVYSYIKSMIKILRETCRLQKQNGGNILIGWKQTEIKRTVRHNQFSRLRCNN